MAHKAFEVIGERVLIIDSANRNKEGIFQESEEYQTTAEGAPRPALDFIEPIFEPNSMIEELAKGRKPRERIDPRNPILSLHFGVDQLRLRYRGRQDAAGRHVFEGELAYMIGTFFNDGNVGVYNKYREALKKAGFEIW